MSLREASGMSLVFCFFFSFDLLADLGLSTVLDWLLLFNLFQIVGMNASASLLSFLCIISCSIMMTILLWLKKTIMLAVLILAWGTSLWVIVCQYLLLKISFGYFIIYFRLHDQKNGLVLLMVIKDTNLLLFHGCCCQARVVIVSSTGVLTFWLSLVGEYTNPTLILPTYPHKNI